MANHTLQLYHSEAHECNYLPAKSATTAFIDPHLPKNKELYSQLSDLGFRRSGEHIYRPACQDCQQCVAVRLPVNDCNLKRHQRRNQKANQDLVIKQTAGEYNSSHFELYKKYIHQRHAKGGMDDMTLDDYKTFMFSDWSNTQLLEFYLADNLIAVSVFDRLVNGLSAVYTFFDPDFSQRGLGKFAVLTQINLARDLGLQWLYLGYWIEGCQKMSYKIDYQPLQYYTQNTWRNTPPLHIK